MTGIVSSIENVISSIFALFRDLLNGVFSVFQGGFAVVFSVFQGMAGLARDAVGFLLNNIVILIVLGVFAVGLLAMQQRSAGGGKAVTGSKKTA